MTRGRAPLFGRKSVRYERPYLFDQLQEKRKLVPPAKMENSEQFRIVVVFLRADRGADLGEQVAKVERFLNRVEHAGF